MLDGRHVDDTSQVGWTTLWATHPKWWTTLWATHPKWDGRHCGRHITVDVYVLCNLKCICFEDECRTVYVLYRLKYINVVLLFLMSLYVVVPCLLHSQFSIISQNLYPTTTTSNTLVNNRNSVQYYPNPLVSLLTCLTIH